MISTKSFIISLLFMQYNEMLFNVLMYKELDGGLL